MTQTRTTSPTPVDEAVLCMSATEMAAGLRDGQLRSRDLIEAHIARIEAVNPHINAMVQTRFEAARAEADAADARLRDATDADALPPLLGVPCSLKENFALKGFPQTSGLVARRDAIAGEDAPSVARYRAAGAIVLGTTNVPELCMWMETNNRLYGRTGNPYDPGRCAGGSAGGEGAIIGAGGAPFGLGADVGGSIRFPAFFNGVFGHKPTPGLVPNTGQMPEPEGQMNFNCVTGPLTRRAEDLWPLLKILAGPDGRDPMCTGPLEGDPAEVRIEGLNVRSIPGTGRQRVARDMLAAQARAGEALAVQGAHLRHARVAGLKRAFEIWSALMHAAGPTPFAVQLGQGERINTLGEIARWAGGRKVHTLPALGLALVENLPMPHQRLQREAASLRQELLDLIGDGVLLFPPYTCAAPRHNVAFALKLFHFAHSAIFNVMGFPVTQVPLGLNRQGLPLGVQVVGAPGRDHVTIAVAEILERELGGWVPPWTVKRSA